MTKFSDGRHVNDHVNTDPTTGAACTNPDCVFFNDSTANLAGSATFTGSTRDVGVAAGSPSRYGAYNAYFFADQAGTVRIENSDDNVTWRRSTADTALTANSAVYLSVPVVARYHRVVHVNGATGTGALKINSSYTVN